MNLSQSRYVVVAFVVVLLLVVAGLIVGSLEKSDGHIGQNGGRDRSGFAAADTPTTLVLLLGLSGPVVAALSIIATDRREATQLEHERSVRMRDERREAYTAFMIACDQVYMGDHSPEATAELRRTMSFVHLTATTLAIRENARELYMILSRHVWGEEDEEDAEQSSFEYSFGYKMGQFTRLIQQDLGIVSEPPRHQMPPEG